MRFLLLILSSFVYADTYIHTSNYIDGISDNIKQDSTIIIDDNGKIKSIEKGDTQGQRLQSRGDDLCAY